MNELGEEADEMAAHFSDWRSWREEAAQLQARLEARGHDLEWADVIDDVAELQVVEVEQDGKRLLLRSETKGTCGKAFQAAGVALPPTVRHVSPVPAGDGQSHSATPYM